MPIYEFACDDCGHAFESFQRLSDPLPDACPACGSKRVHKKISAAGFRLKGGGWYETDFKSGQKKNVSAGEATKTSADSGGGGGEGASAAGAGTASAGSDGAGASTKSPAASSSGGDTGSKGDSKSSGSAGASSKKD